ncbi:MAG: crossover junction endodeoxyribonuclease RuvC [Actinobacteria bacterium]|nr:MAG: crossover junction endodeoxyribonuclease RuvC [Actinomycetota bacterium]
MQQPPATGRRRRPGPASGDGRSQAGIVGSSRVSSLGPIGADRGHEPDGVPGFYLIEMHGPWLSLRYDRDPNNRSIRRMGSPLMRLRTMGIDPGLTRMGLGVVEQEGSRLTALACETIVTSPADSVPRRLDTVFEALSAAIAKWRPDAVAIERIFYKMNARTLVPVAQASGVALLVAARAGAEVFEYAPLEVKLAVVGTGSASKDQMRFMVARLLSGSFRTDTPDAADALAVAICHLHSRKVRALGGAPR